MSAAEETLALHLKATGHAFERESGAERKCTAPNKKCLICAADFYASPGHMSAGWGKFCSIACRNKAFTGSGNPRYINCTETCKCCGNTFHVKLSSKKMGKSRVYCSDECRIRATTDLVKCEKCGKEFVVPSSRAAKGVRFCGIECMRASHANATKNRICVTCGKPFYMKPCDLKRISTAGKFCSVKCMHGSRGKIRLEDGKYASHLESKMDAQIKATKVASNYVREFKFHPSRKWLLDFAWPDKKVGVEVHGGIWQGKNSGHTSGRGRLRDMEKMNEASLLGWTVLEVASEHIDDGRAMEWLRKALSA